MPIRNTFLTSPTSNGRPDPGALVVAGAFLTMDVHLPPVLATALTTAGQTVPPAQSGVALVDTGATMTCVHEPVLLGLGLNAVGTVNSGTANGQVQQTLYMARVTFPEVGWSLDLPVVGVDLTGQMILTDPPQQLFALVGRNLLHNCILVWNGPGGYWTIAS